jgi:hypothetical protein
MKIVQPMKHQTTRVCDIIHSTCLGTQIARFLQCLLQGNEKYSLEGKWRLNSLGVNVVVH